MAYYRTNLELDSQNSNLQDMDKIFLLGQFQYKQEQLLNNYIVTTMNSVTDTLKRNLAERHSQASTNLTPALKPPSNKKQEIFEQKFMQHFQTINKTPNSVKPDYSTQNQQLKFKKTLIDYSSKSSLVDSIITYDQDITHFGHSQLSFALPPIVPGLKPSSLETIKSMQEMFRGLEQKENSMAESNSLMVIEYYSQILKDMGRKPKQSKPHKELSKSPTYQHIEMKQVQTEYKNAQDSKNSEQFEFKPFQKTSRKDLILMELIREKKRKNFAPDYFAIMEMKLMELLEFILEDQSQYIGLDPHTKVREVLKNLEQFQGKMIEGDNKINLLRIFFEEFTNLKREKDQIEAMKSYTPMKGLDNREKTPPATNTGKFRTTKDTFKQSRHTVKQPTPHRKTTRTKQNTNITWIQNQRIQNKGSKTRKANEAKMDEWIGSL